MSNVGRGPSGQVYTGQGSPLPPSFRSLGTNSGLTANGVLLAQGDNPFVATGAGALGQVLTSNGPGVNPSFQTISAGNVTGPGSSTDNNIVIFSGTTGKIIKDTGISSINPTFTGNVKGATFNLDQTTSTVGQIKMAGNIFVHSGLDSSNFYAGKNAGNVAFTNIANTGVGENCLTSVTSGDSNTGMGHQNSTSISTGTANCAFGEGALFSTAGTVTGSVAVGWHTQLGATGNYNVGIGFSVMTNGVSGQDNFGGGRACLGSLGSGNGNVVIGATSGQNITTGSNNTVLAYNALAASFSTGSGNLILGQGSGNLYTSSESSNILLSNSGVVSESNTMRLGTTGASAGQINRTFVAGVNGVTVTGSAVLIATDGQMGTVVSSIRYKKDIQQLENSDILKLNPVSFVYKNDENQLPQVGLIAEEVEEVLPRLCVYDNSGQIQSVKYHEIPTYLLLEIKKLIKRIEILEGK